ncbi:hypothetical protein EAO71_33860 [Streptomyces sp. ms191]|nr:hypothetical protein EAO71_33860 [Streptomyces sp. ms191]
MPSRTRRCRRRSGRRSGVRRPLGARRTRPSPRGRPLRGFPLSRRRPPDARASRRPRTAPSPGPGGHRPRMPAGRTSERRPGRA